MIAPLNMTFYCRAQDEDGVYHAFPVDSTATHDTAKSWAKNTRRERINDRYEIVTNNEPTVFEFENHSFDDVVITDLSYRGNGGRAYQVIVTKGGNKFRMDLREDTLMEVIHTKGIQAGGRLNGSFCFVKESSQTSIILEGTEKHIKAIEEREKRDTFTTTIKRSDLKPGHIYSTLTGSSKVFLGFVYSCTIDEYTGEISKPYKAMLFASTYSGVQNYLRTGEVSVNESGYPSPSAGSFSVLKSHSFKIEGEKVGEVDLPAIVKHLNEMGEQASKKELAENWYRYLSSYTESYILSQVKLDRKDVKFDPEIVKQMRYKANNYYNRGR